MKNSLVNRISAEIDPIGFLEATARTVGASAKNPLGIARATGDFAARMGKIPGAATRVTLGLGDAPRCPESARDRRFSDVAWNENPGYYTIAETYFAARSYALDLIEAEDLWGTGMGLTDVHLLASSLVTPDCLLWTRDRKLVMAAERLGVAYSAGH